MLLIIESEKTPEKQIEMFKSLDEAIQHINNQPAEKFRLKIQLEHIELLELIRVEKEVIITMLATCLEKVETIFGGRNNLTYTLIQGQ